MANLARVVHTLLSIGLEEDHLFIVLHSLHYGHVTYQKH